MPRICFVPGCKTSSKCSKRSKEQTNEKAALFCAPKDPVLRKQWHIASKRADREMTVKDFVCELHFTQDCIERYFITELGGGETFKMKRDRPLLKKGSVPTIFSFSNCKSISKVGRPRKLCTIQNKENGNGDFESRKKSLPSKFSSKVVTCSAYGCTNSSDMNVPGLSFYRFPTSKTRRSWLSSVGSKFFQPSSKSMLCSAHFSADQIKQTGSSTKLRPGAIPTIFPKGRKQKSLQLAVNLEKDFYDSSHSEGNESCPADVYDSPALNSDEDEASLTETVYIIQEESDENPEEMSPSHQSMSLNHFISKNLIAEGYEDVFGKFVANELKILSCDPPLYLRTKEKIWQVLEGASQMRVT